MNTAIVDSKGVVGVVSEAVPKTASAEMLIRQDPAIRRQNQVATKGVAEKEPSSSLPSGEEIKKMVEEMQVQLDDNANLLLSLKYSTYGEQQDNKINRIAVSVVNRHTGEVIREIPSKEIQGLYTKMSEVAGIIFNHQA